MVISDIKVLECLDRIINAGVTFCRLVNWKLLWHDLLKSAKIPEVCIIGLVREASELHGFVVLSAHIHGVIGLIIFDLVAGHEWRSQLSFLLLFVGFLHLN